MFVEKQFDVLFDSTPLIKTVVAQLCFFIAKYSHSPDDNPTKLIEKDFSSKLGITDQSSPPIGALGDFNAPALTK